MSSEKKKNLAIIPARGGSKRLPNKNLSLLGGKPLVSHSIEAALEADSVTDIIVSSDSEKILDIAAEYDGVIKHKRNEELSSDTSTALELVEHLYLNSQTSYEFITLMLPTCPFRTSQHLDRGIDKVKKDDDGVVSLTSIEFPTALIVDVNDEYVSLEKNSALITGNTRSQNHITRYRPSGGFYVSRWESFDKYRNFWKGNVRYFIMDNLDSVDIDTPKDLDYANLIYHSKLNQKNL